MRYDNNCQFCMKFGLLKTTDKIKWYDQVLLGYRNLIVVPALGPFSEGYVMIVSREHYNSVSCFPNDYLMDLINLKNEVIRVIREKFTSPIIFEHGAGSKLGGAGSCINHAHIHISACNVELLPILKNQQNLININKYEVISQFNNVPYIYYENSEGKMYVSEANNIPGQYFRRILSNALGINDAWDYALYPNFDMIKHTIKKLTPWPFINCGHTFDEIHD